MIKSLAFIPLGIRSVSAGLPNLHFNYREFKIKPIGSAVLNSLTTTGF